MPEPGQHYPAISPFTAGLACRCPRCGRGKLFQGLLTVAEKCGVCGLDFGPHDSGDGPAVFVIFILGPIVVPLAIWFEFSFQPPIWLHGVIWIPVVTGGALLLLRPMKAVLVALHYKNLRHEYDDQS